MAQVIGILAWVYMGVVGVGLLLYFLLRLSEPIEVWWKARREAQVDYVRYAAEQAIRDTERRSIAEMLAVYEREAKDHGEIIEGTAIEVRR